MSKFESPMWECCKVAKRETGWIHPRPAGLRAQSTESVTLWTSTLRYGKAISGGFPLAVVAGSSDVMSVLDARKRPKSEVVWATNTLNGNPICAAAGVAALGVLGEPWIYDHLHNIGSRLRAGIVAAGERHGFAVQSPGEDAVFGVRFTSRKPLRTWMDLTTADKDLGWRWALELLKRGLLVNPNEKFYISIAHTEADIDKTLGIMDEAFGALR